MITWSEVNALTDQDFVAQFGDVAEHSPWVASRAAQARPFENVPALVDAFQQAILEAPRSEQLALLRAHPDLAGRAARLGTLTADSTREQKGAGLDTLNDEEWSRFHDLNERYKALFGIPFIFAVKGATKHQILAAFEARLTTTHAEEYLTALTQVLRIVRFRLEAQLSG